MKSNRDYITENINLKQQVIDLKVANKDKAETIKAMKQELLEYNQLRDRFKVLYEENQELREEMETLKKYDMELFATTFKLKKAIEIIKKHISVEKQGNYMYFDYQDNDLTQQEYELLKEVLE